MKEEEESELSIASGILHNHTLTPTTTMLLVRGRRFRSSCSSAPSGGTGTPKIVATSVTARRVPKRRAFIPISSRQTSRVLNNVELDEKRVEFRVDDTLPFVVRRRTAPNAAASSSPQKEYCARSTCSTDSSSEGSACSESPLVAESSSLSNPENPENWTCLRTHPSRYSTLSFGSSCFIGSDENVWVPRDKQ